MNYLREGKVLVIGLGGGGSNAVDYMFDKDIYGVKFFCANTDFQALNSKRCPNKLPLGNKLTRGLGAGAKPEVGQAAVEESAEDIKKLLVGVEFLFVTAGMGGGTGTGGAAIITKLAKELGITTVAVVTKPFSFESRGDVAIKGIDALSKNVDSLIIIPNDRLKGLYKDFSLVDAFSKVDDVLFNATQGIAELITKPGNINIDIADIRTTLRTGGVSTIGVGIGHGEDKTLKALESAISSPLVEKKDIRNAKAVLVNISHGLDFQVQEFEHIGNFLKNITTDDSEIIVGNVIDELKIGEVQITVLISGVEFEHVPEQAFFDVSNFLKNQWEKC